MTQVEELPGRQIDDHAIICAAPSCWSEGQAVLVDGMTEVVAFLCKTHRKSYLGVST